MNLNKNLSEGLMKENITTNFSDVELKNRTEAIISKTYLWMGVMLAIVFGVAYYVYTMILGGIISLEAYYGRSLASIIGGFILIVIISFTWQKFNYLTLAILLIIFSFAEGFGLSGIFISYNISSIINVFLLTSIMFFCLSVAGYVMKIDVTKRGSILLVGLVAIIIGYIVNIFWQSGVFNLWLNVIGVLVFSAFVIYDMNALKEMSKSGDSRVELIMALSIFITFINLFLILLQLFGGGKD